MSTYASFAAVIHSVAWDFPNASRLLPCPGSSGASTLYLDFLSRRASRPRVCGVSPKPCRRRTPSEPPSCRSIVSAPGSMGAVSAPCRSSIHPHEGDSSLCTGIDEDLSPFLREFLSPFSGTEELSERGSIIHGIPV